MGTASISAHETFILNVDPYDITWGYNLRTQVTDTYGGKVIQILGVDLSNLNINTIAGSGGFVYVEKLRKFWREMGLWQQDQQRPAKFNYPAKNYNLSVWAAKFSYDDSLSNVVFPMRLGFQIQEDLAGTLTKSVMTEELNKLRVGVGYAKNIYNDPTMGSSNETLAAIDAIDYAASVGDPATTTTSTGLNPITGTVLGGATKSMNTNTPAQYKSRGTADMVGPLPAGDSVERWRPLYIQALQMKNQYSQSNLDAMMLQMKSESTGNPLAFNDYDSNWVKGTPSKGLLQTIGPTFAEYAEPGYNTNIWDPLSNALASINYSIKRYGSLANAYKGVAY